MEIMFENILDSDEKITKVFKPNKKKFWWANAIGFFFGTIGIFIFIALPIFFGMSPEQPFSFLRFAIAVLVMGVLYLINFILAKIYYKNLFYGYTNKRIVIRKGIFGVDYKSLDMGMIGAVNVYVSLLDKLLGGKTGTITFGSTASPIGMHGGNGAAATYAFTHIEMPYELYKEVKKEISEFKKQEKEETK